jgi:hypothetical protein
MPIQLGDKKIANIFKGDTAIQKVFKGDTLVFDFAPDFDEYELIADVEVTSNTASVVFDNLNLQKNEDYVIVFFSRSTTTGASTATRFFVNDNNNDANYFTRRIRVVDSAITDNFSAFAIGRFQRPDKGEIFFRINNNDKVFAELKNVNRVGSEASSVFSRYFNRVSNFTVSSINKISLISSSAQMAPPTRFTLYKVVK